MKSFHQGDPVSAMAPMHTNWRVLFVALRDNDRSGSIKGTRVLSLRHASTETKTILSFSYRRWKIEHSDSRYQIVTPWQYLLLLPEPMDKRLNQNENEQNIISDNNPNIPYLYCIVEKDWKYVW